MWHCWESHSLWHRPCQLWELKSPFRDRWRIKNQQRIFLFRSHTKPSDQLPTLRLPWWRFQRDATNHQESKMSPSFKRLVKCFKWTDSLRSIHPNAVQFSRYYSNIRGKGAKRIDRCYHYGDIKVNEAIYHPLTFLTTMHIAHVVFITLHLS